jgi:hypothetical protein
MVRISWILLAVFGCSADSRTGPASAKPTSRKIPLGEIYSTSDQEGLKKVSRAFFLAKDGSKTYVDPYGRRLDDIQHQFRAGGSNLALVRGKDLTAAIHASALALLGGRSFDSVVDPEERPISDQLWLLVYFGTAGSTPPAWLIESVDQDGRLIRVTFRRSRALTKDLERYLAWIPLGPLDDGGYDLELFSVTANEPVLRRRVNVVQPK